MYEARFLCVISRFDDVGLFTTSSKCKRRVFTHSLCLFSIHLKHLHVVSLSHSILYDVSNVLYYILYIVISLIFPNSNAIAILFFCSIPTKNIMPILRKWKWFWNTHTLSAPRSAPFEHINAEYNGDGRIFRFPPLLLILIFILRFHFHFYFQCSDMFLLNENAMYINFSTILQRVH